MSDSAQRTFMAVVDPAQDQPIALERVLYMARRPEFQSPEFNKVAKLHVFIAVDSDNTDTGADNPAMCRNTDWFYGKIVTPLEESGVEFTIEISWSSDWYGAIIREAERLNPELLMIPLMSNPRESGRIFNESIWRLMRTAKCPVLVARPSEMVSRGVVLSAINLQSHKPDHQQLNDMIIARSQWMAERHGAELHFVNAYTDSLNYPDRSQLANKTGVDTSHIHVKSGDPEEVIADTAKELGANLIVIGTRSRPSRWRGTTAERIITKVDCDILAIN